MKPFLKSISRLVALAVFLFAAQAVSAATVNLTWDANPASEAVTKYVVYEQTGVGQYTKLQEVTSPQIALTNVNAGTHTYVVAAVNIWSEGAKSDPVSTPPSAPSKVQNLRVISVTVP